MPATPVSPAQPLLIVTRPAAQAAGWVQALQALGCEAQALPLIGIAAAPDAQAVRQAWQALPNCSVVMFVSGHAVEGFFDCQPAGAAWPPTVLAASTGPGTSAALRGRGLLDAQIVQPEPSSLQFDSEALWLQLQGRYSHWQGRTVLVVRGGQGREWLGDTLRSHGAHVQFVVAYQRLAPQLDAAQLELLAAAQARPEQHVWLFSSSEAVAQLQQLVPLAQWQHSQAWVTHPRIAQAAQAAGFGNVCTLQPGVGAAAQQLRLQAGRQPGSRP